MNETANRGMKILVVSGDMLPYPGCPTTGAGLRAWGLGEGLRSQGHDVLYAMSQRCVKDRPLPENGPLLFEDEQLPELVGAVSPDVLVFQHWLQVPLIAHLDTPVVMTSRPLILETAFQGIDPSELSLWMSRKISALRRGDFFTCAGELQRSTSSAGCCRRGLI
jgi:hypothetical protein